MTGNNLPVDLNLIELAQNQGTSTIYVIVDRITNGITNDTTRPPGDTRTTTRGPSDPRLGRVTFTSGRAYLRLPGWSPGRRGRIEFSFKTMQRHGVMMVTSPSRGRSDFFAIEISDGDLYAVFNLGGQTQRLLVGAGVNDGQAHHVIIERIGRTVTFTLDGDRHSDLLSGGDDGSLDLGSTFFVGGTSNLEYLPWLLYSRRREFYRGCLWDLRFDDGDIVELDRLRQDQGMARVRSGCSPMPGYCSATSCEHGGICRERWSGQLCYCALTAYTDRRCHRGT